MPEPTPPVLLIRINSGEELFHTMAQVDLVQAAFPDAPLWTLATPQTETLEFLHADSRFAQVLLFPPAVGSGKTVRAFRRFMARQPLAATVAGYGSTRGYDYTRHLLSSLICPGRKFWLDAKGNLFSPFSPRGVSVLARSAAQMLLFRAVAALQQQIKPRRSPLLNTSTIQRILWVRLDQIGDVVTSLPALRALKACFPQARIDAVVRSETAALLADEPSVEAVLVSGTPQASAWSLRRSRYDLAVELRGDDASRLLAFQAGARQRLGPRRGPYELPHRPNCAFLMTHLVSPQAETCHAVDANLNLLREAGLAIADTPAHMTVTLPRRAAVTRRLTELGVRAPFAVFHARPGKPAKEWGAAPFARLADAVIRAYDFDILLSGGADDAEYNEAIRALVSIPERMINGAGKFTLAELPALIEQAQIMVSVDTGPMHIAAACGTPVVALMLPWNSASFYPYGQKDGLVLPTNSGLQQARTSRMGHGFLQGIQVQDVLDAIERKLMPRKDHHAYRH